MKASNFDFKLQPSNWQKFWFLDPEITFLNHGAFGACPKPVLEAQQRYREQLEREPLRFFAKEFEPLLDQAREKLAAFVGAGVEDIAFVPNATSGVNAVLRSLEFKPGDELLTTDQEYNASRNALNFAAERSGAEIVVAAIPFPIESPAQIVSAILQRVSPKTRLVLIDHISSQTGLIFPVQEVVSQLTALGIDTLIDGAHAPGMVPLNLRQIGATYYTGNCHKWLSAPKGAAFLYVRQDRQALIRPLTISHGANSPRTDRSRFQLEFDWMGTADPSAYLSVPVAIEFLGSLLAGGWPQLMAQNHALAVAGRDVLCQRLGFVPPCPNDMIGSMASLPLPDGGVEDLYNSLFDVYKIQVPVIPWPAAPKRLIRISAQVYNFLAQYEYLGQALVDIFG